MNKKKYHGYIVKPTLLVSALLLDVFRSVVIESMSTVMTAPSRMKSVWSVWSDLGVLVVFGVISVF